MAKKILTAEEAVRLVKSGMTLAVSSFLAYGLPESLCKALGRRFEETGEPRDLTLFYSSPVGIPDGSGCDHFAHEGMLRRVVAGHWNLHPALAEMAMKGSFEAYNLPQGVLSRMTRELAAHGPGVITHVGLNTFVDPRMGGGRLNSRTNEDLVEVITLGGREWLHYLPIPLDIVFIRGTVADERGNISVEDEGLGIDVTAIAQAVHNNGGKVIVQVGKIVPAGTLDPWKVKVPGVLVDALVLPDAEEDQVQNRALPFDASITSAARAPQDADAPVALDNRKIIARRAAMELKNGIAANLGIGMPEYVAKVAREEGFTDVMTLSVESGATGGTPRSGSAFGANTNVEAILDQPSQFDFYDGGGLDQTYLGLAQVDESGNVNVSLFSGRLAGCGGFIDIAQNAHKVTFCGTFTAGGLKTATGDGKLTILQEGKNKKFLRSVDQVTFSARYAVESGQPVLFITERAVFTLDKRGLVLTEIAPGVDLERDVLAQMEFAPVVAEDLKLMDERIFRDEPMGLVIQ